MNKANARQNERLTLGENLILHSQFILIGMLVTAALLLKLFGR